MGDVRVHQLWVTSSFHYIWSPCHLTSFSASVPQPNSPPPPHSFDPPLVQYTDDSVSVTVLLTSFTSAMLLKRTRPQTRDFYWYDNWNLEIGKFTRCLRSKQDWIRIFFAPTPSLDSHPATRSRPLFMTEETSLIVNISFLQVTNDAQLDDAGTVSKSSTHHARSLQSSDYKCKLQSEAGE